jgi:hypothetical protein
VNLCADGHTIEFSFYNKLEIENILQKLLLLLLLLLLLVLFLLLLFSQVFPGTFLLNQL